MNNIEDMQKSFEGQKFKVFSPFKCDISKNEDGNYVDDTTIFAFAWFCRGIASQAHQTESQWINLSKDDYSHLKGNELIYAYGIGCGIFEAYLKGYEVVRDEVFFHNTSEVSHIMVRKPVVLPLPPAPEGDDK